MNYSIGTIARLTNRTREAIRLAERLGRIPQAQKNYRGFRFWSDADLPAICAAFGVEAPPTTLDRLIAAFEVINSEFGPVVEGFLAGRDPEVAMRQAVDTLRERQVLVK